MPDLTRTADEAAPQPTVEHQPRGKTGAEVEVPERGVCGQTEQVEGTDGRGVDVVLDPDDGLEASMQEGAQFQALAPVETPKDDAAPQTGVLVVSVQGGSDAAQHKLAAGDIVTKVGERDVTDLAGLAAALEADQGMTTLTVKRGEETVEINVGE